MSVKLKKIVPLAAVLAYAAALNLYYLGSQQFILMRDSYAYLRFAADAAAGNADLSSTAASRPPLLIQLLIFLQNCGADPEIFGVMVVLTATLGAVAAVYFLAELLFEDRFQAAVAAWLTAAVPGLFYYGGNILRDPLYWCAALWCIVFFCRALWSPVAFKKVFCNAAAAGLAAGLAAGIRWEWPELGGFMVIALIAALFDPARSKKRCFIAAAVAGIVALTVVSILTFCAPDWTRWRPYAMPDSASSAGEGVE